MTDALRQPRKENKGELRFEKGVKAILTDVERQQVTIRYDAEKNTAGSLVKAFARFGYKATLLKDTACVVPTK